MIQKAIVFKPFLAKDPFVQIKYGTETYGQQGKAALVS